MRRAISASAFACSSALSARLPLVSSASSGRPSDQVTSQAASSKALPVPWPNETPACLSRSDAATTSSTSVIAIKSLERRAVDVLQHVEARDLDVLVDLVDARVDRAELDDLLADPRDEAAVGRAAGGRELGLDAGSASRIACASASLSAPGAVRNGSPPSVQAISCSTPWRATIASSRSRSDAGVDSVLKRKLKSIDELARDDVAGAGAGVDVRHLPRGRREVGVAAVPLDADQLGEQRRGEVDRVLRQLRIGDVALHAADAQLARERAAAAVLDRVAEPAHRRRLADDAVVEARAALGAASRRRAPCRRATGLPRRS